MRKAAYALIFFFYLINLIDIKGMDSHFFCPPKIEDKIPNLFIKKNLDKNYQFKKPKRQKTNPLITNPNKPFSFYSKKGIPWSFNCCTKNGYIVLQNYLKYQKNRYNMHTSKYSKLYKNERLNLHEKKEILYNITPFMYKTIINEIETIEELIYKFTQETEIIEKYKIRF